MTRHMTWKIGFLSYLVDPTESCVSSDSIVTCHRIWQNICGGVKWDEMESWGGKSDSRVVPLLLLLGRSVSLHLKRRAVDAVRTDIEWVDMAATWHTTWISVKAIKPPATWWSSEINWEKMSCSRTAWAQLKFTFGLCCYWLRKSRCHSKSKLSFIRGWFEITKFDAHARGYPTLRQESAGKKKRERRRAGVERTGAPRTTDEKESVGRKLLCTYDVCTKIHL